MISDEEIITELEKIAFDLDPEFNDPDRDVGIREADAAQDVREAVNHIKENNWHRAYDFLRSWVMNKIPDAVLAVIKEKADEPTKAALERLGGDKEFVYEYILFDDEGGWTSSRRSSSKVMLREMLETLRDSRWHKDEWQSADLKRLTEMYMNQYDESPCTFFGTPEEYNKKQQDERRRELEQSAKDIAYKHGVKVDSLEFLKAVQKELREVQYSQEEWNNPEVRMEEWAACRYAGVGADVYFDDLNFENGRYESRIDHLHGIMEWVSENCPLLWAKFENDRLNEKDDDEESEEDY